MSTTLIRRLVRSTRRHPRLAAVAALAACLFVLGTWLRCGPLPPGLLDLSDTTSSVVVDRRGVPLYEALSGDGTRSIRIDADALPPFLVAATVAAEDRRFWSHAGVDPVAVARALKHNLAERRVVEGGSTITQQVAKLLLGRRSPDRIRGFREKVREAMLAVRLEHRLSKQEILTMYLNLAAYGNQIVGAARASRAYFGVEPALLTPAQAAFLAGLPQRPTTFNPYRNPEAALSRQRVMLRRMEIAGALGAAEAEEARQERLSFTAAPSAFLAPHFVEMVLASGESPRPARLPTTLDAELQAEIAGIIRSNRPSLERHRAANVAVVVLDNARGEWLAWEGSGDYFDAERGGTINGPLSPRQPGSALKPFTYALAFEEGFTPASVLPDIPSHFPTAESGVLYSPRNYDGRYYGPLLARRALAGSRNVPAVALASELGVPKLLRFLIRAGLSTFEKTPSHYGLGITLGNAEVRLDELVAAYSTFARGGGWLEPTWRRAESGNGPDQARTQRSVVSPLTAYWITDILSDASAREYVFGRGGSLDFPFPVAVKTGTSQAYHDNWAVGFNSAVTVGVWVGNFDRTPLRHSSGITGAGPIFHAVMIAAARRAGGGGPAFGAPEIVRIPAELNEREVCATSGMSAHAWCPSRQRERIPPGEHLPCSWHHLAEDSLFVIWPPEYRRWAGQEGLLTPPAIAAATLAPESRALPPALAVRSRPALEIVNPPEGATYLVDPTLRREFQTLPLRVVTSQPGRIEWFIDGRPAGTSSSDGSLMWPLTPGTHRIAARDGRGRTAETSITVR